MRETREGDGETHNFWDTHTHGWTEKCLYRGGAHLERKRKRKKEKRKDMRKDADVQTLCGEIF